MYNKTNISYYVLLLLIWIVSPFVSIFVAILLFTKISINRSSIKTLFFFISLSFSLLAYTQKSLYWEGTDIERYYQGLAPLLKLDYTAIPLLLAENMLNYVFIPVNIVLVIATRNVQSISIFWIFIIYYFFFLSILNFLELYCAECIKNRKFWILLVLFCVFGAILFTQVTETIKSAVAFSLFWYTFTLYLKKEKIYKILALLFIGIGIHAQTLMFLPIFLFKKIKFIPLLCITTAVVLLCTQFNIINVAMSVLPSTGWTDLLMERTIDYGSDTGSSSSIRYLFIGLLTLITCWYLQRKDAYNTEEKIGNIILLYIIVMFVNYNNSHAFIRFANFISFIATIEFIGLYRTKKIRQISYLYIVVFMLLNLQMTYGRTLSGGYCSSYMDNSIAKVLLSNVYDYLTYKAYNL